MIRSLSLNGHHAGTRAEVPMPPSDPVASIRSVRAPSRAAAAVAVSAASCASYEPPKPGVHRAPGDRVAESVCGYETPTASTFIQMRCRSAEDINRTAAEAGVLELGATKAAEGNPNVMRVAARAAVSTSMSRSLRLL